MEYFTGNITNQSLGDPVERYTVRPWQPEFKPEEKHFASENFAGFSLGILSEGSAKLLRSSVGCSVAQKGAAYLRRAQLIQRVQRSS